MTAITPAGTLSRPDPYMLSVVIAPSALHSQSIRDRIRQKVHDRANSVGDSLTDVAIDKASGALMRLEGYDWNGQLVKRFEVVSAQKIQGRWFLKQMRVEELHPGTNHVLARTYLEIKR